MTGRGDKNADGARRYGREIKMSRFAGAGMQERREHITDL